MKTPPWLNTAPAVNGQPVSENFKRWFGASTIIDEAGLPLLVYHGSKTRFDTFEHGNASFYGINNQYGPGFYLTNVRATARHYGPHVVEACVSLVNPISKSTRSLTPEVIDQIIQRSTYQYARKWHAWNQDQEGQSDDLVRMTFVDSMADKTDLEKLKALVKWFDQPAEMAMAIQDLTGHDGVIAINVLKGVNVYTVFKAQQIKAAFTNTGNFDPASPSMTDTPALESPSDALPQVLARMRA